MKKIAFGLQVFTLITLFPLYVIIELNHTRVTPSENKNTTEVPAKVNPTVILEIRDTK